MLACPGESQWNKDSREGIWALFMAAAHQRCLFRGETSDYGYRKLSPQRSGEGVGFPCEKVSWSAPRGVLRRLSANPGSTPPEYTACCSLKNRYTHYYARRILRNFIAEFINSSKLGPRLPKDFDSPNPEVFDKNSYKRSSTRRPRCF